MTRQRVNLYVDAANLYGDAKANGERLDYAALLRYAGALGAVGEAAIYAVRCNGGEKDRGFLVALKQIGFTRVVARHARQRPDGQAKSDLDTVIAMDVWAAALQGEMTTTVLVSGDSDFVPLVERLVERGIPVYVIGPDRATAWEMIVAATKFLYASQVDGLVEVEKPATSDRNGAPAAQKPGG